MKHRWIAVLVSALCMLALLAAPVMAQKGAKEPKGRSPLGPMQKADTDGDGKISKKEFLAFQENQFKKADKNGDQVLDADELKDLLRGDKPADRAGKKKGKGEGKKQSEEGEFDEFDE